jgi:putative sterol carrier protein
MLSLKTRFDPGAAADLAATIGLSFGDAHFGVHIEGGRLDISRGNPDRPDLVLDTDEATLLSVLNPDGSVDDALASGWLRLSGDTALAQRLRHVFPIPADVTG